MGKHIKKWDRCFDKLKDEKGESGAAAICSSSIKNAGLKSKYQKRDKKDYYSNRKKNEDIEIRKFDVDDDQYDFSIIHDTKVDNIYTSLENLKNEYDGSDVIIVLTKNDNNYGQVIYRDGEWFDIIDENINEKKFSTKKRKKLAKNKKALSDGSFPIENTSDLKNAIKSYGLAKDKDKAKNWIKKRAKELNATNLLPKSWSKINENINIGDTIKVNAVWDGKSYVHFNIHPGLASMYGNKKEDIEVLTMKISEDQERNDSTENKNADYWGFFDFNEDKFSLIYPKFFLLEMCFPYGIKAEEDANKGHAYRLEIINNEKLIKESNIKFFDNFINEERNNKMNVFIATYYGLESNHYLISANTLQDVYDILDDEDIRYDIDDVYQIEGLYSNEPGIIIDF